MSEIELTRKRSDALHNRFFRRQVSALAHDGGERAADEGGDDVAYNTPEAARTLHDIAVECIERYFAGDSVNVVAGPA